MSKHLRLEDLRSDTWRRLTQHLQDQLKELRESNDSPSHDTNKTALIRGQIKAIKEILDLTDSVSSSPDGDLGNHVTVTPVNWQTLKTDQ